MIRKEICELMKLGPLPSDQIMDKELVQTYEDLIMKLKEPVTDEEAQALIDLLGPDSFHGLAWNFIHLIESSPGWPKREALEGKSGDMIHELKKRITLKYGWEW